MAHFAVTAVGADRPGIVAAVTGVLVEHDCNLEDTSMTVLRGHFAMMLVVAAPGALAPEQLERALAEPAAGLGLVVTVRAIDDDVPESPPGEPWHLSVYGADRPGIVHRVTRLLADRQVNVTDLSTRVIGSQHDPVYAMVLDLTLPAGVDPAALDRDLHTLAKHLGVDCSLHPVETDIL
jgi:glycine cleavage system transcriptional repressor